MPVSRSLWKLNEENPIPSRHPNSSNCYYNSYYCYSLFHVIFTSRHLLQEPNVIQITTNRGRTRFKGSVAHSTGGPLRGRQQKYQAFANVVRIYDPGNTFPGPHLSGPETGLLTKVLWEVGSDLTWIFGGCREQCRAQEAKSPHYSPFLSSSASRLLTSP